MDFIELDEAIRSGLNGFKQYIHREIQQKADFLEHFFWVADASQMTMLNYLIRLYKESSETLPTEPVPNDLMPMIEHVVGLMDDKDIGAPLHQAVSEQKTQLAIHLLELNTIQSASMDMAKVTAISQPTKKSKKAARVFNVDQRDSEGRTLLSLVLASKNLDLLTTLLKQGPNVHIATHINRSKLSLQPLHQAVVLNHPQAIHLLAQQGAQLGNPCGKSQDTPVLLAAHLCNIDALEALLEHSTDHLMLEAERVVRVDESSSKQRAIERLCEHVQEGKSKAEALRGIAMLLCRGAEPPRSEPMCQLLSSNRSALLKTIHSYLEDKPDLVDAFVTRCHLTESALHNIVYAHHSWSNAIRHLFGKPSDVAFMIENLVVRKYSAGSEEAPAIMPTAAAEKISLETDPLKLYALFVKRYTEAYDNQLITNSWSTMRWMIAEGQCDWAKVQRYAQTNPKSRSAIIYNEMFKPMPKINEDLEEVTEPTASVAMNN